MNMTDPYILQSALVKLNKVSYRVEQYEHTGKNTCNICGLTHGINDGMPTIVVDSTNTPASGTDVRNGICVDCQVKIHTLMFDNPDILRHLNTPKDYYVFSRGTMNLQQTDSMRYCHLCNELNQGVIMFCEACIEQYIMPNFKWIKQMLALEKL